MAEDAPRAEPGRKGGLFQSAKALLATLVAIGHNRLELFSVELQEEVARAASMLLWSAAALLFGMLALGLAATAILLAVPVSNRVVVAVVLAAVAAIAALVAYATSRSRIHSRPRPFDATLSELAKDRDRLSR